MKTIKLLGSDCEEFEIPLAATTISDVLQSEIECHEDDFGPDGHNDDVCVATLSLTCNKLITSAALRKVAAFVTHYVTEEEMTPFEPPFTSENLDDIVKEQWYRDFITIGVDRMLLLDLIAAANFLSIQPLLKLAALAISLEINGKTPNEIRHIFGISNDLSNPEERKRVRAENEWIHESRRPCEDGTNADVSRKSKKTSK
ncbi:hypothetical protein ACHAWX_005805 [Stephanocyclus meneghinianus]